MAVELTGIQDPTHGEEERLARYVESLYRSAKQAKDPVAEKVNRFYRLWKGEHYQKVRLTAKNRHRTRAVSNFIFGLIETEVTWLTENRPSMIVVPQGANDAASAKIIERILLDYLWHELNLRSKIKRVIRSALIRGKGFVKVTWNQLAYSHLPWIQGEVAVDYVPWREIFLDPQATSCEDARYIIHARVLPLSEIVRRWPENGWRVTADPYFSEIDDSEFFSADVDRPVITPSNLPLSEEKHRALVLECWIRDDSYELHEEVGMDGEITVRPQFLYPHGRLVIVANGVVLTDTPNPFRDGEFPFADLTAYEDDESVWGMGEVEQLESPQRVINALESRFVDSARTMTNTVWIKDANSGVKSEDITNAEGQVITKNPGTEVRREPPPSLPEWMFNLYLQMQRNMETITGLHDVTQGRRPVGITAATAISLLQEAGQARVRDKARNLEDFIRRLGRLIISRIVQYYTPDRVIRIRGTTGTFDELIFDPSTVEYGFDLYVESGTSLQMDEQQRFQMGLALFQAGALDVEGLLEVTNFPGRDEVIERIRLGRAILAQQQQEAAVRNPQNDGRMQLPVPPGVGV